MATSTMRVPPADPFQQTRHQFARLTALSVTAFVLMAAISIFTS